jgi:glycine/D-amino acid oxidase-like deaminating enzyme
MTVNQLSLSEETSFWARDYGPYDPSPPLRGDVRVDVAVIGAGFTGLNTARDFAQDNANASIAVLESALVGHGSSGRNGGFSMKLFGIEPEFTKWRWGVERTVQAHRYAQKAVARVKELIEDHDLPCDYRHTGLFRVSYTPRQQKRLEKTYALFQQLGIDEDMSFYGQKELQTEFQTERYLGAIYETETGILNPCKHVRALKRLAVQAGAQVYEETPVTWISRSGDRIVLRTPEGTVETKKLVLATNAYSRTLRGLPKIRSRQVPVWTFQVVTERLSPQRWASIGWANQQSFEDNRQLVHYFRPTADGRITMGGGDITAPFGDGLDHDFAPRLWRHCEEHLKWIFPQLRDVRIEYRWGGPVSVNTDLTPEIGFIGDERVIYSTGCIGHGLSLAHLNGRLIADLLNEKRTELTDFWIVNRRSIPWPPEPLSFASRQLFRYGLRAWDFFEERGMRSPSASPPR